MPVRKSQKPKSKPKQKQRQHQRQTVIVNVIQPKRARRQATGTRRRGATIGVGGGGVGGGNYVSYPSRQIVMNAPSDYVPIIHNVLPPMLIKDTPLSLPTSLPVQSIVEYKPTPTELQTPRSNLTSILPTPKTLLQEFYDDSDEFIEENPMRSIAGGGGIPIKSKAKVIDVSQLSPAEKTIHEESIRKRNITPPITLKKQKANLKGYTKKEKALHDKVLMDIRDAKSEDIGALPPPSQRVINQRIQRANNLEEAERKITEREK